MFQIQRHYWVDGAPFEDDHIVTCSTLAAAKYRAEWLAESYGPESCFWITEVATGTRVAIYNITSDKRWWTS